MARGPGRAVGTVAGAVGRGLFAGAIGTAAMTVSSTIEARLRERPGSDMPATIAGRVLGVQPRNPAGRARFSQIVHWGYGTSLGALRGLLDVAGLGARTATGAHFAMVWGAALAMPTVAGIAEPFWTQPTTETAIDGAHHLVYALATGAAYAALAP